MSNEFEKLLEIKITNFPTKWDFGNYAKNDLNKRKDYGQFFTPPKLCAIMLSKIDKVKEAYLDENENIKEGVKENTPTITGEPLFDPTAGCGNLLAAGIAIGWDPKWVYANELDPDIWKVLVEGLTKLGVPENHIRCGDIFEMTKGDYDLMEKKKPICGLSITQKVELKKDLTQDEYNSEEFKKLPFAKRQWYLKTGKRKK